MATGFRRHVIPASQFWVDGVYGVDGADGADRDRPGMEGEGIAGSVGGLILHSMR